MKQFLKDLVLAFQMTINEKGTLERLREESRRHALSPDNKYLTAP